MEGETARFLGVKYATLTTSGSCAGLLALQALELPKGSDVIISAVTFPTIYNIILQCGHTPVVVDAKVGSYTFDIDEVERAITHRTRAIIAIHPVGNPVDMPRLMKMVRRVNKLRNKNKNIYSTSHSLFLFLSLSVFLNTIETLMRLHFLRTINLNHRKTKKRMSDMT